MMPGDSDQVPLLPKDMAEDTEMSAFGMSSLQNRIVPDKKLHEIEEHSFQPML